MLPFTPRPAATVNIAVSASSQNVAIPVGNYSSQIRVFNGATETVFINFGADNTVTASASTGLPIPSGAIEVLTVKAGGYVAAIGTGSSGTIYFTPGDGI